MTNRYDDIINLPHPVSKTHPKMSMANRAAQFAPFAALTGYNAAIKETARLTCEKIELDEDSQALLDQKQQFLVDCLSQYPKISITYFQADKKKAGGRYETISATVKKIDEYRRCFILMDDSTIPLDDIINLDGEIFRNLFS